MFTKRILIAAVLLVAAAAGIKLYAHCQIPCGIYNDPVRVTLLQEHVTTLEKSMTQIVALSEAKNTNHNQITRWVKNKEDHADALIEIVTQYFMAQRIKPKQASDEAAYAKYVEELTLLHRMIVSAMKAKQSVDLKNVSELRALIKAFSTSYLGQ